MNQAKLNFLKGELRCHMNGTTASIMRNLMGSAYAKNYGLSIQHIRDIARDVKASDAYRLTVEEADELWATRWREMMLIGIASMDPQTLSEETVLEWASTIPTPEAAEAMAFLLTGHMPSALKLAHKLLTRNTVYDYALACQTAARAIQKANVNTPTVETKENEAAQHTEIENVIRLATQMADGALSTGQTTSNAMALSFLLRQCATHNLGNESVTQFETNAAVSNNAALRSVAADVAAEREML